MMDFYSNSLTPDTVAEYVMASDVTRGAACDCGGICFCSSYRCGSSDESVKQMDIEAADSAASHELELAMYSVMV